VIYAIDTNVIIHLLHGTVAVRDRRDEAVRQGNGLIIPPYVHFEMRRGFLYKPAPAKEKAYRSFCSIFSVGEMTDEIWEAAAVIYAELRKNSHTLSDADILIAAFCIVNGCTLVTNNTRHFENVAGLILEDWVVQS